jgi:hypothetical protein
VVSRGLVRRRVRILHARDRHARHPHAQHSSHGGGELIALRAGERGGGEVRAAHTHLPPHTYTQHTAVSRAQALRNTAPGGNSPWR